MGVHDRIVTTTPGYDLSRLHVQTRGSGTPLLMLHGFTVDHRILLPFEDCFEGRNWRRILIDLPGFGASPALPAEAAGVDAMAEVVAAVVDAEIGAERFAVLGNSFGGMLARDLACRRPEQLLGLALIAPLAVAEDRDLPERVVLHRDEDFLATLPPDDLADYAELAVTLDAANFDRFERFVLPGLRSFDEAAAERLRADYELSVRPESRLLAPLTAPGVMVLGRQDHVVGFQDQWRLREHYPRMSVGLLDGAGHNVHLDQPTAALALVSDWLDEMAATSVPA